MSESRIDVVENDRWVKLTMHLGENNAMNRGFTKSFGKLMDKYEKSTTIRAMVVTAAGKYFSNGFDPKALIGATEKDADEVIGEAFRLTQRFHKLHCITICAINGHCMGMGAVLSLFADYRFMVDKKARFGFPEALIGMALPNAPALSLQDLIGGKHARDLAITGKGLKPEDAKAINLIDEVYTIEELVPKAEKFAANMAKMPLHSIAANKMALRFRYSQGLLDNAWKQDIENTKYVLNEQAQEGLRSILEGRRPVFE